MAKYKKRSDGRYLVQVQVGIKEDGKPQYKNIYAHTIKELEEKAAAFRSELEKGIVVDDKGLTVAKWSMEWLQLYKLNKSYNTIKMYTDVINAHIIPSIGTYKLIDLKPHHVQRMFNEKAKNGLTRGLDKIKITLNQILEQAVKNEFIYKNVMDSVEVPKYVKSRKRALSEQEIDWIYNSIFDLKEKAFVYTLLYTGLRRGEILALTKNDIDLKNRSISVEKSIVMVGNRPEIKNSPKTEAGNRIVPIIDELFEILSEYIPTVKSIYVFPSNQNALMTNKIYRCFWDRILTKINQSAIGKDSPIDTKIKVIASDITPHIFRHTYATTLYYAGVDMKTAQYLLGHASINMTMDIYTHLQLEENPSSTDKLNEYFRTKKTTECNKSNNS